MLGLNLTDSCQVRFTDCQRVAVKGVTLRNSPDWTQLYVMLAAMIRGEGCAHCLAWLTCTCARWGRACTERAGIELTARHPRVVARLGS